MPPQAGKSFGFGAALAAHAGADIDYGMDFGDLPGGITGGVAEFREGKIGTYKTGPNAGKEFVRLVGVVHSPRTALETKSIWENGKVRVVSAKDIVVAGKQTSIMVPLCDTSSTFEGKTKVVSVDEHAADLVNHLNLLANDKDVTLCLASAQDEAHAKQLLTELFQSLADSHIFFRFDTQSRDPNAQSPNSGTWPHKWRGSRDVDQTPPEAAAGVTDKGTPQAPATRAAANGSPARPPANRLPAPTATAPPPPAPRPAPKAAPKVQAPPPEPAPAEVDEIDALVQAAEGADRDPATVAAKTRLAEMAVAAGNSEEVVSATDSWGEVADLIRSPATAQEPEPAPAEDLWAGNEPKPSYIYRYQPIDARTKRPAVDKSGKPRTVEVEVTACDEDSRTVDLRSNEDKKTLYKAVPWDSLESADQS